MTDALPDTETHDRHNPWDHLDCLCKEQRDFTDDELQTYLFLLERNERPEYLHWAWEANGVVPGPALAANLGHTWACAEYPLRCLDEDYWRDLFWAAGFTRDGIARRRVRKPRVLYRGAVPEQARGWSWTADRAVAETFASGQMRGRLPGRLYRAVVQPRALLAEINDREESEWVVDPDLLGDIEEVIR